MNNAIDRTQHDSRRGRRHPAIPKDDPRRKELLAKGFMQDGYIEGLPDGTTQEPHDGSPEELRDELMEEIQDESMDEPHDEFAQVPYGNSTDMGMQIQGEPDTNDFDTAWASELIGDAPDDYGEDESLVSIGGHGQDSQEPIGYDSYDDPYGQEQQEFMGYGTYGQEQQEFMGHESHEPLRPPMPYDNASPNMMDDMPSTMPPIPPQSAHAHAHPQMSQVSPEPVPDHDHDRRRHHHRGGRLLRTLKRILLIVLLLAMFVGGFAAGLMYEQQRHPAVSAAFIETQLSECSDLATAKMHYNGLVHYEDGEIPLINKKTFSMTYQAEVRAGVDLSKAEVSVSNGEIVVTLPKATVQTTSIDPSSVKFFDQTWGLFSWESKDDAKTALEQAQKDLEKSMDDMRLIEEANLNAERAIRGLIAPILKMNDGYRLTIRTAAE